MVANQRIVFIGDSITQAGKFEDSEQIGYGYVRYIKDYFVINQPEELPIIFNKGINGNRIPDLEQRWEADVLSLCPNLVSISIGINDVWRQLDHPEWKQVTPVRFREIYDRLLEQVTKNTEASIFLMEPTIIEEKMEAEGNILLKDYVEVIHQLAERYSATVVPTHQVFIEYLQKQNHQVLTTDGVHMNSAGNMLMAQTWLKAYNKYMEAKKKTL
ncbi:MULTISPECIES: SGNH/GDSL hydrolase family protein [Niallia]|uniref:SGNH/GDSL hydrolase family protein n=2 Tax=Niallia TaxID=2837506 RepID=A0A941GEI5_NIACI|nr:MULTISPECIES: SGNH/GDSL hydrolase family protein [Niallia]MDU1845893.1 SGNH/GDSL hydrolase family protein [Niallia nealsonii]MCB5237533.1 SGNH/GDSL hydrolase family protein [Niallia circulans]MED3794193.1 SGNH/GDSL hydrolase family protein [Niallia alba]NMO77088.1 SGNH/GDSL hydrolase family protein [Niallia alba]UTI40307.1 SGNH/GDSL hydrolase family protein [Niallia sp. RD1]